MKTVIVNLIGPEEKRRKALKMIKKSKGNINAITTLITEEEENEFFDISFEMSTRRFNKNVEKLAKLGNVTTA